MNVTRITLGLLLASMGLLLTSCHLDPPPPRGASYERSMQELDRIGRIERARWRANYRGM